MMLMMSTMCQNEVWMKSLLVERIRINDILAGEDMDTVKTKVFKLILSCVICIAVIVGIVYLIRWIF